MKRLVTALCLMLTPLAAQASGWTLDTQQTRIAVGVGYLGKTVTVRFPDIRGAVDFDPDRPQNTAALIRVDARDAETGLGIVNALVRSGDYLDTRRFPEITFRLTSLTVTGRSTATVAGSITMLGVTRPASFDARLTRFGPASKGGTEARFDMSGEIDRAQFGNTAGIPQVARILPVSIQLTLREGPAG